MTSPEPLEIDYKVLINDDMSAHNTLIHTSRWYFYKLGHMKSTQHSPALFEELAKRVKNLSDLQLFSLRRLTYHDFLNKEVLEVSVLVDGTESWKYKESINPKKSGTYWTDERLKDLKDFPTTSRPFIGDRKFEIGPGIFTLGSFFVFSTALAVCLLLLVFKFLLALYRGPGEAGATNFFS